LLRVVRRRTAVPTEPLVVIGIDDWAFRRNHRYGTIVCDLERRQVVTLLPDGRQGPFKRGWPSIPRSRSCRAIAVAAMARLRPERCRRRSKSPTAGI
jgi:transposase